MAAGEEDHALLGPMDAPEGIDFNQWNWDKKQYVLRWTNCRVSYRPRKQWDGKKLTISGPPEQLRYAKQMAIGIILGIVDMNYPPYGGGYHYTNFGPGPGPGPPPPPAAQMPVPTQDPRYNYYNYYGSFVQSPLQPTMRRNEPAYVQPPHQSEPSSDNESSDGGSCVVINFTGAKPKAASTSIPPWEDNRGRFRQRQVQSSPLNRRPKTPERVKKIGKVFDQTEISRSWTLACKEEDCLGSNRSSTII